MSFVIRVVRRSDIAQMYGISSRAHRTERYYSLISPDQKARYEEKYQYTSEGMNNFIKRYTKWLGDGEHVMYVAIYEKQIAGYVVAEHTKGIYYIRNLFVDPVLQSQGIGSLLLEKAFTRSKPDELIRLTVLGGNDRALRLYHKHGFVSIEMPVERFYGARQIAMERRLY